MVSSSEIDSYPFHLVFNYTPTPQSTCPKLLQRKSAHTHKSSWTLHFLFSMSSWGCQLKAQNLILKLGGLCCHSRLILRLCVCVWIHSQFDLKVAPWVFVWSRTLTNLLRWSLCVKKFVRTRMCMCAFEVLTPVVSHHESSDSPDEWRRSKAQGLLTVQTQRNEVHVCVTRTHLSLHVVRQVLSPGSTLTTQRAHSALIHALEFHSNERKANAPASTGLWESLHAHEKAGLLGESG